MEESSIVWHIVMEDTQNNTKGLNPIVITFVILLILGGVYALFSQSQSKTPINTSKQSPSSNQTTNETQSESEISQEGSPDAEGVKTFEVEAGSFYFSPNTITVNEGDKVRVIIKSADQRHTFSLDEFNVGSPITEAGQTSIVEFTASRKGSFEFYCSVGEHRANGQIGTLIVQ